MILPKDAKSLQKKAVEFPRLVVSLRARRVYRPTVMNIYLILGLITLSSLGAFAVEVESGGDRLAHASTILLSTIAFLYVIESSLPKLSYMTITDYFVFCSSIYVLAITIEVAVVSYLETHWNLDVTTMHDNWLLLANFLVWLVYNMAFLLVVVFKIMPVERVRYLPPGIDKLTRKCIEKEESDLDFSMQSRVSFKRKECHSYGDGKVFSINHLGL